KPRSRRSPWPAAGRIIARIARSSFLSRAKRENPIVTKTSGWTSSCSTLLSFSSVRRRTSAANVGIGIPLPLCGIGISDLRHQYLRIRLQPSHPAQPAVVVAGLLLEEPCDFGMRQDQESFFAHDLDGLSRHLFRFDRGFQQKRAAGEFCSCQHLSPHAHRAKRGDTKALVAI